MSQEIVRAVSRQLDHYLRVQRLEDGFDHSGTLNPMPLHPPLWDTSGSLISARRLHDKPLKHQFSDKRLRARLRRMHPSESGKTGEAVECAEDEEESQAESQRTAASSVSFAKRIDARLDRQRPLVLPQPRSKSPLRGGGFGSPGFLRSAPPMPYSRRERDFLVRSSGEILTYLASADGVEDVDGKSGEGDSGKNGPAGKAQLAKKDAEAVSGRRPVRKSGNNDGLSMDREAKPEGNSDANRGEPEVVHIIAPPDQSSLGDDLAAADSADGSGVDSDEMDESTWLNLAPGPRCYGYTVTVVTGDRVGAGTRHPVQITLCGERGVSQAVKLTNSETHRRQFARGRTDKFRLTDLPNVGQLRGVKVEHLVKDEAYAHWFLESVEVIGPSGERWRLPCGAWLSAKSVDRRTTRWLKAEAVNSEEVDVSKDDEDNTMDTKS